MENTINLGNMNIAEALATVNAIAAALQEQLDAEKARQEKEKAEAEHRAWWLSFIRDDINSRNFIVTSEKHEITSSDGAKQAMYSFVITDGKMRGGFKCVPGEPKLGRHNIEFVTSESGHRWRWSKYGKDGENHFTGVSARVWGRRNFKTINYEEPFVDAFIERCERITPCYADGKVTYLG